jgi:hypothetical protein
MRPLSADDGCKRYSQFQNPKVLNGLCSSLSFFRSAARFPDFEPENNLNIFVSQHPMPQAQLAGRLLSAF